MPPAAGQLPALAFVVLAVAAGVYDVLTRRIPNGLTLTILLAGLAFRAQAGVAELGSGVVGAGLAFLLAVGLFRIRALGGGDGKLLIGVGAFLGLERLPGALLLIGVLGGLLGVVEAVRQGVILPAVLSTGRMLRRWLMPWKSREERAIHPVGTATMPYGVAISAGSIIWWFWGGSIP